MPKPDDFFPPTPRPSGGGTLVFILLGPLAWFGQFSIVYAVHTLGCTLGAGEVLIDFIVGAVTLLVLAATVSTLLWPQRWAVLCNLSSLEWERTAQIRAARMAAVLGVFAILWTGASIFVSACSLAR